MTKLQQLIKLNQWLLGEMPQYQAQANGFARTEQDQWKLFRSLVNIRKPHPASDEFIKLQDEFLQREIAERGITDIDKLTPMEDAIYLWQGDITTLRIDAIVNAANSGMTGCYCPMHGCIDNAIHTYAGVQLRLECAQIMQRQGCPEPIGRAKLTGAYNLPCRYIIHTVGPMVKDNLTEMDCRLLASCYRSCLELAQQKQIKAIAFCCISTGEFRFPSDKAAAIAVETVKTHQKNTDSQIKVVFNVFCHRDYSIYRELLQ